MDLFLGSFKIIDIICILYKISQLGIDRISRAAFAVILCNKCAPFKRRTVQSENFTSDLGRKIMTFQIGGKIV